MKHGVTRMLWRLIVMVSTILLLPILLIFFRSYKYGDAIEKNGISGNSVLIGTTPGGITIIRMRSILFSDDVTGEKNTYSGIPWGSATTFREVINNGIGTGETTLTMTHFDRPSTSFLGFGFDSCPEILQTEFPPGAGYGISEYIWRLVVPFWAIVALLGIPPLVASISLCKRAVRIRRGAQRGFEV